MYVNSWKTSDMLNYCEHQLRGFLNILRIHVSKHLFDFK